MTRKTCGCGNYTNESLDEFSEIGWNAFQISNKKVKVFCPNCVDKFKEACLETLGLQKIKHEWKKL